MWKWEAENPKGTIVIVHGAQEHHGRYTWLLDQWKTNGYNVIMGDLPGQGLSTRRRGHIDNFDEYIEEVEKWIKEAYLLKPPVFVIGHSMGGLAVIRTLQEKKPLMVDGVILSSPCLKLLHHPTKGLDVLSKGLNFILPKTKFKTGLTIDKATRNEEIRKTAAGDELYITKVSVRWYRELVQSMNQAFTGIEKFPDVPVLLLQAGEDLVVDKFASETWFNSLSAKEKTYKEWEGLYHEIFNEPERARVFRYAKAFVDLQLEGSD
ncbi:alpha/beta hydrolase [Sutcliffiella horikoshii]|uniref:Alpha/beta hydrolase n=1 Tax=Sutcliffiella horikoshii TaxID=79883 RepID=A0A5D4T1K7_9BACI|nr:alpha/beta hydrolase [Sutcliffiella horikoshii]TYS69149.1 alpha/beta hydrolase [Sutcliffiella horikoshii]